MTSTASALVVRPILSLKTVSKVSRQSRATIYRRVAQGLWTRAVRCGANSIGWPEDEIAALNNARIAGKSDEDIRKLVKTMELARKEAV